MLNLYASLAENILQHSDDDPVESIKATTFNFAGTLAYGELDKENYRKALVNFFSKLGPPGEE